MRIKCLAVILIISFTFLLFFICIIYSTQLVYESYLKNNQKILTASVLDSTQNIPLEINARSVISVENNFQYINKIIFKKDSDKKLPIASLTKLMTAVIVLDNYNLSDIITVDENADLQNTVNQDVKLGDTMSAENFLNIMLIKSSNKSAYALSEKIGENEFVNLMNKKAKEIGLENTSFADPTGLSQQNISTADDLVKLSAYILKNYPKIASISREKELDIPNFGKITNTDELLNEIPEIVFSKTGFTEEAKGCLLLIINNPKNNDYIINVILGSDDRFQDMKKLINFSNKNI